jgi:hypothetical protein
VWTHTSVNSEWVSEEAQEGKERGVLVPLRLDRVRPPLGFRSYQYADLAGWKGGAHSELNRLVKDVAQVLDKGVRVEVVSPLDYNTDYARQGATEAKLFIKRIGVQSAMYKQNPGAAAAINEALVAISSTYKVVSKSIDEFLKPIAKGISIDVRRYRPYATGALVTQIEEKRGRCTELAEKYISDGGLKDNIPEDTPNDVIEQLDQLFLELSEADNSLFDAMASIGQSLTYESSALVNLLVASQKKVAFERLKKADRLLAPLVRDLNTGKTDLNRVAGKLGLEV